MRHGTIFAALSIVGCLSAGSHSLRAQAVGQAEPSYSGTWVSRNNKNLRLTVERTGDKIHVQEFQGTELKSDYTCGISGKDCTFEENGHEAKVSLWLNGPKLVELRTRGSNVTKRRFTVEDKGSTLEIEVLPISPPGETQTIAYSRDDPK